MSDKTSSNSTTGSGGYTITSSGTNSQVINPSTALHPSFRKLPTHTIQGNHYNSRDYGASAPNQNSYHYSNRYVVADPGSLAVVLMTRCAGMAVITTLTRMARRIIMMGRGEVRISAEASEGITT